MTMSIERITELTERAQRDLHRAEEADDEARLEILEGLYRELEGALEADDETGQAGH
jgi:hypothetical protein